MTKREAYEATLALGLSDELKDFYEGEVAKMDAVNEKRKEKPSKKALANKPYVEAIGSFLTEVPQTANDLMVALVEAFPDEAFTIQRVSSLALAAQHAGLAVGAKQKITGKGEKKVYTRP